MRVLRIAIVALFLGLPLTAHAVLGPTKGSQLLTASTFGACPVLGHGGANSIVVSQMVNGDGSVAPFVIPPKKIFVLTDLVATSGALPPGDVLVTSVVVGSAAQGAVLAGRFDPASASGTFASSFTFAAGVAVKSGTSVCVEILNLTHGGFVGFTAFAHGSLAPDK